jgi:thiol:disulfide interchange protein DsbD
MSTIRALALLLAFASGILAPQARAAASAPATFPESTARLLADTDAVRPGQRFRVALELTAAPGWHTYWHDPGDAGAPPTLDITAPGLALGAEHWEVPQRLVDGPEVSFGYTGTVLLMRDAVARGRGPLTLSAHASWLVCKDVCIPKQADFTLTLSPASATATPGEAATATAAERQEFEVAASRVPGPAPFAAHIAPDGTLWIGHPVPAGPAVFFPDKSDAIDLDTTPASQIRNGLFLLAMTPAGGFDKSAPLTGVIAFGAGAHRVAYRLAATPAPLPASRAAKVGMSWSPTLLFLAFAGGLLLNLMPCVFPVLAMKALGLAAMGGRASRHVRREALAYTAGVLLSFGAIATLLLALRAAGQAAGWGFQFQWPGFVAGMCWLFFAIGLILFGGISIGGRLAGVGQSLAASGGMLGSLATGVLAVLVATPCTAPFMGAALAAAATQPAPQSVALFLALGLGFSLPWSVLALFPSLAARLPRPGAWMIRLREALSFPMFATALWLGWIVTQEAGPDGALRAGAGCLLIALAAWLLRAGRSAAQALSAAILACTLLLLPGLSSRYGTGAAAAVTTADAYTPAKLAALRAAGRPVLVNMTASWCVTCLVNERAAIEPALPRLRAAGVAYLVGDWTDGDQDITRFLGRYGRVGVPLYVFFPAGLPADAPGRVLPQILTPWMLRGLK